MDILLSLKPVSLNQSDLQGNETSEAIRQRVIVARQRQYDRYREQVTNGEVPFERLLRASPLLEKQEQMIKQMCRKQGFSNRVHIKVIRLARTIADLKGERDISDEAIWEAFTLRRTRKKGVGSRSLRTN
jgi:magnesium chelatase family protein